MNTVARTLGLDTFEEHVKDVKIGEIFRLCKFWNDNTFFFRPTSFLWYCGFTLLQLLLWNNVG